jgi:hypothetical protein
MPIKWSDKVAELPLFQMARNPIESFPQHLPDDWNATWMRMVNPASLFHGNHVLFLVFTTPEGYAAATSITDADGILSDVVQRAGRVDDLLTYWLDPSDGLPVDGVRDPYLEGLAHTLVGSYSGIMASPWSNMASGNLGTEPGFMLIGSGASEQSRVARIERMRAAMLGFLLDCAHSPTVMRGYPAGDAYALTHTEDGEWAMEQEPLSLLVQRANPGWRRQTPDPEHHYTTCGHGNNWGCYSGRCGQHGGGTLTVPDANDPNMFAARLAAEKLSMPTEYGWCWTYARNLQFGGSINGIVGQHFKLMFANLHPELGMDEHERQHFLEKAGDRIEQLTSTMMATIPPWAMPNVLSSASEIVFSQALDRYNATHPVPVTLGFLRDASARTDWEPQVDPVWDSFKDWFDLNATEGDEIWLHYLVDDPTIQPFVGIQHKATVPLSPQQGTTVEIPAVWRDLATTLNLPVSVDVEQAAHAYLHELNMVLLAALNANGTTRT